MAQLINMLADSVWLRSPQDDLCVSRLRSLVDENRKRHRHLAGKNVAIHGAPAHVVLWMLILDGFAGQIALIPQAACEKLVARIAEAVDLAWVAVDDSVSHSLWPEEILFGKRETGDSQPKDLTSVSTHWLLATSGTTSTPKLVKHSLTSLTRSIGSKTRYKEAVWGLLYDPARFAGLQVVLQALIGGGKLVVSDNRAPLSERVAWAAEQGVTALSATPTLWRNLLMIPRARELMLNQITLGGEIADGHTLRALASAFPNAHITHIYASTEAGVGFAVHDGQPGFPETWLDTGINGIDLRISTDGILLIRPPQREQQYVGSASTSLFDEMGWLETGDLVEPVGGRILFRGRANGSINVGGNKVMPEEVEAHILQLPLVQAVFVRARGSSVAGALLEALIVPHTDAAAVPDLTAKVRQHCRAHLPAYKVPAFVKVVESIPMTASGKIARNA